MPSSPHRTPSTPSAREPFAESRSLAHNDILECINGLEKPGRWEPIRKLWNDKSNNIAEIFLAEDFSAWVGYALLYCSANRTRNFEGKKHQRDVLKRLNEMSVEGLREVATQLHKTPQFTKHGVIIRFREEVRKPLSSSADSNSHASSPPDVVERSNNELLDNEGPNKRICTRKIYGPNDPVPALGSDSHDPSLTQDTTLYNQSATIGLNSHAPSLLDHDASPRNHRPLELDLHLENAPIEVVKNLFPEHTFNSIAMDTHPEKSDQFVAALTMSFSTKIFQECQMSFEVPPYKIEYLAGKWFGAQVEAADGLRSVSFENGRLKVVPLPQLILQGFPHELIECEFGSEVGGAVMQGFVYQTEVKKYRPVTRRISLRFGSAPEARATVTLYLDLVMGTKIKAKLWG